MKEDIRKSVLAGSWYPAKPEVLRADINDYLNHAGSEKIAGEIIGLVAPHAGYVYSGQVAAYAYKTVYGRSYDSVIVISPSHRMAFAGVSVYQGNGYETPLGIVQVDVTMADAIRKQIPLIEDISGAHRQEHALEIQLPFLQIVLGDFSLVPLIMGTQDYLTCEILAQAIVESVGNKKVLVVGSSDLSHFHSYTQATKMDAVVLSHLEKMDASGLLKDLENNCCEACGGGPVAVTMMVAGLHGANRHKVLKYANSGDVTGDRSQVVGYAAAVFSRE